jgi:hypothetical protein
MIAIVVDIKKRGGRLGKFRFFLALAPSVYSDFTRG